MSSKYLKKFFLLPNPAKYRHIAFIFKASATSTFSSVLAKLYATSVAMAVKNCYDKHEVETMDIKKIGLLIKTCRQQQGLTQKQLAAQLNLSDKAISKWERGGSLR